MTPLLVSAMVFVGVAAMVGTLAFVFRDKGPQTATRLDLLVGKRRREDDQTADILRKTAFENDKKSLLGMLTPTFLSPQKLFEQADCHIKPSTLFGIGVLLGVLGATVTVLMRFSIFLAPLNGLVMFVLPFLWLYNKRRVRLKKFAAQLSDALELVARALRAGHSLAAGMHVVAEEMPSPVADEFGRVFEEQNLGIPIEESMKAMCERVPNLDLRFFVTSVGIQRQTGGDLAEILDKIGYVIRERFRILGQVKALTGEGRLSGVVLIALPFALFGFMLNIKPDYVESLWTTELGKKMSIFAVIAQILGALVIRKIVNIKV
ncbi:MAG TPA: type II secretion system F family protein [Gemmataceae bacterium]|nr:type II secretion system F family protein [Gemmataceae bacterium]